MPVYTIVRDSNDIIIGVPCFGAIIVVVSASLIPESPEKEEMLDSKCEDNQSIGHPGEGRSDDVSVDKTEP